MSRVHSFDGGNVFAYGYTAVQKANHDRRYYVVFPVKPSGRFKPFLCIVDDYGTLVKSQD